MRLIDVFLIGSLFLVVLTQTGCASFNKKLKNFLGGNSQQQEQPKTQTLTKFSQSGDVSPRVRRQYKRTTKESLADESSLDSKAGSLWVMEGQGAYLFSQNVVRLLGDPLAVTIEGDSRDQLLSKVNVIKKLLARIDERQRARLRNPAAEDESSNEKSEKDKDAKGKDKKDKSQSAKNDETKPAEPEGDLGLKIVPTRIVERTVEGNYRIKGTQPFMIGMREYKVIVTGIVRAEDFNDDGIPSSKLLDPKFDIVSARHKEESM